MGVRWFLCAVLICLLVGTLPAFAAPGSRYDTIENSSPQKLVDAMANKAARGIANTALGWVEFPKQIYLTTSEDGVAKGVFVGPVKGVGMTLIRTVVGVAEFVTFFVAYPGFYDPYFEPDYVWQKE
jgi:putative exosortase-associated protein (TIGR04073 family)